MNIFDGLDEMRLAKNEIRRFRLIDSDGDQLHTECLLIELCFPCLLYASLVDLLKARVHIGVYAPLARPNRNKA